MKKTESTNQNTVLMNPISVEENFSPVRRFLPVIVIIMIIVVLEIYSYFLKQNVIRNAEHVTNQMAEYVANNIANEEDYARSSIKLAAVTISQTMTSDVLENPSEIILPMIDNTPFGGIEYIRADGMNVMNIGEPFDASNRVYYIEGIKGNTGVWNNYHPKTSKDNLMNFYTPLVYDGNIVGVITGYIEANAQLAPLFETNLYGKDIYGLILDENNMVICSTLESEYVPELSLDMFMDQFTATEGQKQEIVEALGKSSNTAVSYKDSNGEGRICTINIPNTSWKVAIIVPAESFDEIISENTRDSIIIIIIISLILILYAAYILIWNVKRRKEVATQNAILEEENHKAIAEITEIRDIIASANMGTWRIEIVDGEESRMYVDETMKNLLGTASQERTPEMTYMDWYSNIVPEAVESVLHSVERMEQGYFDENTYLWNHPTKGTRYVRCGGTAQAISGGFILRGYHYDVDDVVREDQAKVAMLWNALSEKNEYYNTLGALGDIFYSMHVIDLKDDTVVEFTAKDNVKEIVNHKNGASEMMVKIMSMSITEEYREDALEFTDLSTLADRMKNKQIISQQLVGNSIGWVLASFVTMETDEEGRPTKVIYTTRNIDEEKKQEEKLIRKSQTDELTGLLNRRAYEEDIYEHNDIPEEDDFIYISLDVNGLKIVNDTQGHMAGDELIMGACQCMKESLGSYGKLYRIGGDEFVAILFCDTEKIHDILKNFDDTISKWSGKLVNELSVSYGWISKDEKPDYSVRQLGAVAEGRMYQAKSLHYRKKGVDRRGQQDAHKALCELYTKILKINISDDTYQIVNMDVEEQTVEKGFSENISEWLKTFGTSGQVHPEDLPEYLRLTDLEYMRAYFAANKTSLHIFYRRRYEDSYKQVMMEIIPASDYSNDNQSLFLYVKDIDK